MSTARQFGTIRKLPNERFQARYSHLCKQVGAKKTFPTKTAARQWLSSVETDLSRGEHFDQAAGSAKFGAYALQWLDERPLPPRTQDLYESQMCSNMGTDTRPSTVVPIQSELLLVRAVLI